jgi:hypothetical protein
MANPCKNLAIYICARLSVVTKRIHDKIEKTVELIKVHFLPVHEKSVNLEMCYLHSNLPIIMTSRAAKNGAESIKFIIAFIQITNSATHITKLQVRLWN